MQSSLARTRMTVIGAGDSGADSSYLVVVAVPATQSLHVFNVGGSGESQAGSFETPHAELEAIDGDDFLPVAFDVRQECRQGEHSVWHDRFESCTARKDNDRVDNFRRKEV